MNLTSKARPISHHLAKFHGDRSRELGDWGLSHKKQLPPKLFLEETPNFGTCCLSARISNHVSNFHGDRLRQLGDIAPQIAR